MLTFGDKVFDFNISLTLETDLPQGIKVMNPYKSDEVQRINTVIRQLLDLARPKDTQHKLVSVGSVIEDIVDVMQLQPMMSGIKIELDLAASNDLVWGNTEQLRQVFLNLLLNAADAIQSAESTRQGQIQVRTIILDRAETSTPRVK